MSFSHWITVAVVAFLPLAATAQQSQLPGPADASATVPAIGYVSAFENYRATPVEKATPDQLWRAANEEITNQDMQGGHMAMPDMEPASSGSHMSMPGMEQGTSGSHMSMPRMGPAKSETRAATLKTDTPTVDPHAGHHNMQGK